MWSQRKPQKSSRGLRFDFPVYSILLTTVKTPLTFGWGIGIPAMVTALNPSIMYLFNVFFVTDNWDLSVIAKIRKSCAEMADRALLFVSFKKAYRYLLPNV